MTNIISAFYNSLTGDNQTLVQVLKILLITLCSIAFLSAIFSLAWFLVLQNKSVTSSKLCNDGEISNASDCNCEQCSGDNITNDNNAIAKRRNQRNIELSYRIFKIASWATVLLALSIGLFFIGQFISKKKQGSLYYGMQALSIILALGLAVAVECFSRHLVSQSRKKGTGLVANQWQTFDITFAGVCIALSFALSYVRLFRMPAGGSVTLGRYLPLAIYCFYFGFKKGFVVSFAYSWLELLQDPWIYNVWQTLLDYTIPFTSMCLVGLFGLFNKPSKRTGKKSLGVGSKWMIIPGLVAFGIISFVCRLTSGAIVFGDLNGWGDARWVNSAIYNSTVFVDVAISIALGCTLFTTDYFPNFVERYIAKTRRARQIIDEKR